MLEIFLHLCIWKGNYVATYDEFIKYICTPLLYIDKCLDGKIGNLNSYNKTTKSTNIFLHQKLLCAIWLMYINFAELILPRVHNINSQYNVFGPFFFFHVLLWSYVTIPSYCAVLRQCKRMQLYDKACISSYVQGINTALVKNCKTFLTNDP